MRITESKLRQLIREALLNEIHITSDNLPDGVKFTLHVSAAGGSITLYASQDYDSIGSIVAFKTRGEENPCLGAYEIRYSKSEMDGLGPLMYDIVMEIATELGGGLISDRHNVSTAAQRVWQKYQDSITDSSRPRPDVERLQLDSPENELTRTRKDNCSVNVSKNLAGDDLPAWRDHPLSGAYRKPGMPMIRRLVSQGKLEINGFKL